MRRRVADSDPRQQLLFDEPLAARALERSAPRPQESGAVSTLPNLPQVPEVAHRAAPGGESAAVEFRHPDANREIHLGGHRVGYVSIRSRRRSIGFQVSTEGLCVSAPRWVGSGDVEAALQAKAGWILRKLHEQRERGRRLLAARIEWRDGTVIRFLGTQVIVVLDPNAGAGPGSAVLQVGTQRDDKATPGSATSILRIGLPPTATAAQIRDSVQCWLQRQARRLFEERCRHFAPRLGVRYTRLALSSAQTRWGSASADGSIRLNWRLVHFGLPSIDYVVAHELAHLREMNHSPRFWDVVRSVVPEYEHARSSLKDGLAAWLD